MKRLAELLPSIERGASDNALLILQTLAVGKIDTGITEEKVKAFLNQGLLAHQDSVRKALNDPSITFPLY